MTIDDTFSDHYEQETSGFFTILSHKNATHLLVETTKSWLFWKETQTIYFNDAGAYRIVCLSGPTLPLALENKQFDELVNVYQEHPYQMACARYEDVLTQPLELRLAPWITIKVQIYDRDTVYAELQRRLGWSNRYVQRVLSRRTAYTWAVYAYPLYSLQVWDTTFHALSLYGVNMKYQAYRKTI